MGSEENDLELAPESTPQQPSSTEEEAEEAAGDIPTPSNRRMKKHTLLHKLRKAQEDAEVLQQWSLQEASNVRSNLQAQHRAELYEELYPSRTWPHVCFHAVKLVTVASGLAMGLGQLLGVWLEQLGWIQYVLRLYVVGMCTLVVLNELEWFAFTRDSKILRVWVSRGIIYSFVGVLGLSENAVGVALEALQEERLQEMHLQQEAEDAGMPTEGVVGAWGGEGLEKFVRLYVDVVAWAMVAMGILYFALGLLCCQIIYGRIYDDYEQRQNWGKRKRQEILKKQQAENQEMQRVVDKQVAETVFLT